MKQVRRSALEAVLGGDRTIVGRSVTVNGKPYSIVGVMPAGFTYPDARYQLWAPLSLTPSADVGRAFQARLGGPERVALRDDPDRLPVNRNTHYVQVVARLKPIVSLMEAQAEIDPDDQLTFGVVMSPARYAGADEMRAFQARLVDEIAATPGVRRVGATTHLPFSGQNLENGFTAEGFDVPPGGDGPVGGLRGVTADYFAALGVPIKNGRTFTAADREGAAPVAIVNETFARRYWPGQDPIGKRLRLGGPTSDDPWRTVVGVVGDVKHSGPAAETRPEVDLPYSQLEPGFTTTWARGLSASCAGPCGPPAWRPS